MQSIKITEQTANLHFTAELLINLIAYVVLPKYRTDPS